MNYVKRLLASSDQPSSLGQNFRNKRFKVFEELLLAHFPTTNPIRILDIGGAVYFWKEKELLLNNKVSVTLLNLKEEKDLPKGMKSMAGDATDLAGFGDRSFDLVFSNSVIEHLYTYENQQKMAQEVMRVGEKYFVQTPNKHFIVEPHYAVPFIQYFPNKLAFKLLTKTKISRMERWNPEEAKQYLAEIRLLNEKEMRQLFPQASIYKEMLWGMTKSFSAHNF